jgi:hypothetical protein
MARLSPISRGEADAGIAACWSDPNHYVLDYGNWHACCTEDASGNATCIVCTDDENCSRYEELRGSRPGIFGLLQISSGLRLAAYKGSEPDDSEGYKSGNNYVSRLVKAFQSEK